jgi:CHASE2 domain-containing sensor protein
MSHKVLLKLGAGNLHEGFQHISAVLEKDGHIIAQVQGSLPCNPELQSLYYRWQFSYAAYYEPVQSIVRGQYAEIEIEDTGIEGFSENTFQETYTQLQQCMWEWLESPSFSKISNQLRLKFQEDDEIAIIIETQNEFVHRLPWHFWSLLQDFRKTEVAFSLETYQHQRVEVNRSQPRILAVFGDSTGIDLAEDAKFIRQLHAEFVFLDQPSPLELSRQLDDPRGWDLLFFAGHGSDDGNGTIQLNPTESLTLMELSHALASAIAHGLQLAIFNSCSGLSLATDLAALNMPTVIVMREAIPNRIAQNFLRDFLKNFAQDKPLLTAVRNARQQLQVLERDFPCATWLPVVFWNPSVAMPTWQSFQRKSLQPQSSDRIWQVAAVVTLLTSVGIWIMRAQGYLEPIELTTYDAVLNNKWVAEAPDPRILVVGVNEEDFRKLGQSNPLDDRTIAQAIQNLHRHQPRAIGLDIYRDRAYGKGQTELLPALQYSEVISSCKMPGTKRQEFPVVSAPANVAAKNVGFTNFSVDRDGVLRRQLLGMSVLDRQCDSDHALSMRLALKYFGVAEAEELENGNVLIGQRELKVLDGRSGGYRSPESQENLRGYQIMLNYRHNATVAQQVSLDDVLSDRVPANIIQGKVILIGYVAASTGDVSRPAYRARSDELAGVMIHAHMVSNILSHVVDGRPLITMWSDLAEQGWILLWSSIGGIISWRLRGAGFWLVGGAATMTLGMIYVCCFNLGAVWTPVVPAELGLISTSLVVAGWRQFRYN